MIKRTLYFGSPAYLKMRDAQLKVIEPAINEEIGSIPIEDIGVAILDHPRITITSALLQSLAANNAAVIGCDDKHMPTAMFFNLDVHHTQNERFRIQIDASEPLRKQLWAQTVKYKVANQSAMLKRQEIDNKRLEALVPMVKSGDSDNVEGRAASIYWKLLFKETDFTRERFGEAPNAHLNYCYAVLRAIVARALAGSGLLPTLGIHHKNKYNAYCLADDIMEPYRPFCDELVYKMWLSGEIKDDEISKVQKAKLLAIPTCDVLIGGKKSPLMVAVSRTTNSLFECFEGSRKKIIYPEFYAL